MTDIVKARERLAYIRDNPGVLMDLLCAPDDLGAERIAEDLRTLLSSEGEAIAALEPFALAAAFFEAIYDDSEVMMKPAAFVDAWRNKHGRRAAIPQFVNGDLRKARSLHARACGRKT